MKKEPKSGILSADKSADHRLINRPTVGHFCQYESYFRKIKKYIYDLEISVTETNTNTISADVICFIIYSSPKV